MNKIFGLLFLFCLSLPVGTLALTDMTPTKSDTDSKAKSSKSSKSSKAKVETKVDTKSSEKPGGWGSSGGGSGVACFANSTTANQAQEYITRGLPVPQDLKKQIIQLETLDYWEWAQTKPFGLFEYKSKDYQGIIKELQKHASIAAPIFIYRLQQTSQVISLADWNNKTSVPRIYDAQPASPLPENCRLIQLAARYTKEKYEGGNGPTLYRPIAKVDFDQDLFAKLDPLNQAILVLHEQMYLLGQTTGHDNSNKIRPLVMRLFQKELTDKKLRYDLVVTMGDYVLYFGEDFRPQGAIGTQESRFNSFYDMNRTLRRHIDECAKKKGLPAKLVAPADIRAFNLCKDEAMDPNDNQRWLTDEMAFLFMSYYYIDISMGAFNSEVVIAPIQDFQFESLTQKRLQQTCAYIITEREIFKQVKMTDKAIRYCQILKF
jgi:hypothetical protein